MRFLLPLALLALSAPAAAADRGYMLTNFDRIRVDGPYDVVVTTGLPTGARADGDRRSLDRVSLRVDGGTLVITTGTEQWDGWRGASADAMRISVTVPTLRAALINGGGRLTVDRVKGARVDLSVNGAGVLDVGAVETDQLNATLTGTGAMKLAGRAGRASIGSYGAGSIDAGSLLVNELNVRASTTGEGRFAARYTARVSSVGLGAVTVDGKAKCTVSGSGPVFCGEDAERRK